MKRITLLVLSTALIAVACIEELDGFLYLGNFSSFPPDTTFNETVELAGSVVRTPARTDLLYIVTVTGGALTVSDTANLHGLFAVTIPLQVGLDNNLIATASDGVGSSTPSPWTKTVTQIDTTAQPPQSPGG